MSRDQDPAQYSSHWTPQASREQYPSPPQQGNHPAPSPYAHSGAQPQPGDMVTLPPPQSHLQQELYRPHNHYDMYPASASQMAYSPQNPHQNQGQQQVNYSQPAPRQRTAIACRYCRRRKIRCHGFDSSPDGRCTNCLRFHQECIFTPVSSQAHAFVPAHTAYPHLRNTGRIQQTADGRPIYPPIYGAHGQPLGPVVQPGHESGYPPQGYSGSPYPGPIYDDRAPPQPHTQDQQRLGAGSGAGRTSGPYEYPDPTHMAPVSPASSTTSYQSAPYPHQAQQQPYYPSQPPPRRSSPQSSYSSYESHTASSPHGSASSTSGYAAFPGGLHPPQVLPPTLENGRTPPPSQGRDSNATTNGTRPGMRVTDILSPGENGQGARSNTDSNMLNALNRRGM